MVVTQELVDQLEEMALLGVVETEEADGKKMRFASPAELRKTLAWARAKLSAGKKRPSFARIEFEPDGGGGGVEGGY